MNASILLVDDDPDIRDSLRIILEKQGYRVQTASDGQTARAALKDFKPDLLILDVMMASDTEGFELAYELRDRPGFESTPILLLTGFLDKVRAEGPEAFQHIMGRGWPAEWMFEKPVDTRRLLDKIASLMGRP